MAGKARGPAGPLRVRPGCHEVAKYVMKLRTAVTELAGDRTVSELGGTVEAETAQLLEELRQSRENDYWNTRSRPALLKSDP